MQAFSFFVFPRPRFIARLIWIISNFRSRVCRPGRACTNLAHRIRWSIILCMNHAEPGHRTPTIHTVQRTHATTQCAHTASHPSSPHYQLCYRDSCLILTPLCSKTANRTAGLIQSGGESAARSAECPNELPDIICRYTVWRAWVGG